MPNQRWTDDVSCSELLRMCAPGVLGFYDHCEVTEVVLIAEDRSTVSNVFSIVVLEEATEGQDTEFRFLNGRTPFTVKGFRYGSFGVTRYWKPVNELIPAIRQLTQTSEWTFSGAPNPLRFGQVATAPRQFAPPTSGQTIPWNHVLKNNFWNGSYVFEWADRDKRHLEKLFENPEHLQCLSEAIQQWAPLRLASLSDRLGNLVVQLPVKVLISNFVQPQQSGDLVANVVWHPKATPRSIKAACRFEFDNAIEGFGAADFVNNSALMSAGAERGTYVATIWDDQNDVILASTGDCSFIESIPVKIYIGDPEPRLINVTRGSETIEIRIDLVSNHNFVVGRAVGDDRNGGQTTKRIYKDEVARLKAQRRFLQYNPRKGDRRIEHERALEDIRSLIDSYGENGVWLWDPYLSAYDILATLVHCKHSNADLRGLGSGKEPANISTTSSDLGSRDLVSEQRVILDGVSSNWRGLNLEYRIRQGSSGWGFHDRFLIFPGQANGAIAWSLGTSINSVGKEHHILQQVDDGQLVMDAFKELWDELHRPECIVWKKP